MNLLEAFVKLDEDAFDTTPKGIEDLSNFMDDADVVDDEIEIIDPDIDFGDDDTMPEDDEESEEENAHVGQLVLQCNTCNALVYKDKDEVELDEEGNVEEEECPNCHNVSKFDVIGKICTVDDLEDELEGDEEESEEKEEDESEKPEDESEEEVEVDDVEVDDEEEEEKPIKEESLRRPRKLKESFSVVDISNGERFGKFEDSESAVRKALQYIKLGLANKAVAVIDEKGNIVKAFDRSGKQIDIKESLRRPRKLKESKQRLNETLMDAVLDRADGVPYNPREFYQYVNGWGIDWYDDVAHEMDEGEEEDVANAIIRGLQNSIRGDGGDPHNPSAEQLYKFVKDSTWLTNDRTGDVPEYIKNIHNELYGESLKKSGRKPFKESIRRPMKKSLKEDVSQLDFDVDPDETVIYLFPLLWWEDVDAARGFGLWMDDEFSDEDTTAIAGRFEDLVDFADNYLDYQLVDGYLLDENGDEIWLNESLRRPRKKSLKEGVKQPDFDVEPDEVAIYIFPKLEPDDISVARNFNLSVDNEYAYDDIDTALIGKFKDLKNFATNYLDYQLVDGYLLDKDGMRIPSDETFRKFQDRKHKNKKYTGFDESCDKKKSSPKDKILKDIKKLKKESLEEDLEGITVDTDSETIQITQKEDGGVAVETSPKAPDEPFMEEPMFEEPPVEGDEVSGDDEVIEPLTDEEEEEIAEENPESEKDEEIPSEEDEEEIEYIDSDSFDELGESYLKEAYENVKSFKTNKVYKKNGKLVVEGIVSFKSGKNKKTSFIFESAHNKSKKKVLLGENKQITPNSKSFRLRGVVKNKKMVCESLRYNYKEGKNRVSGVCRVK